MSKIFAKSLAIGKATFGCRRAFSRHLQHRTTVLAFAFCTVLFTQTLYPPSLKADSGERPNILLILADDLGYGDLGYQGVHADGARDLQTPHIDQLFDEGLALQQFYADCCVCSPTRAALLTGCSPDRVGVPGVIRTITDNNWGYLQQDRETLPQSLAANGYHTAIVGKWHLGLEPENHPLSRGFQSFHGFLGDMMDDYFNHRRHGINYMRNGRTEIDPEGHATDLFSQWGSTFIREQSSSDKPWMLYLAYNAPHTPIQPPADWLAKVKKRQPGITDDRAALVALIEHMDDGIGKVLQALEDSGQADNTIVVFTSDNGGQVSVGANNGPLRGGKGMMYEGGLRVAAAIRWPGHTQPGTTTTRIGSTIDLLPTLCEATQTTIPDDIDGVSLLPLLSDPNADWPQREVYYVRREGGLAFGGLTIQGLRSGPWKLVQNTPFEPMQLFNLDEDPEEQVDRKNQDRSDYHRLAARLRLRIQAGGAVPWQKQP
ncbi:sulfatase-like hydrolase/transferase [Roseimaritima multifibrata]|uniref:sulfatase-like hydrolase/transferase n=1 Tax=Roseimaritima multifibrata TaxID=1930274 RepID=UPI001FECF8D3|nr:sulfatase-like hydrolase/transferase [Roseimaritima multifibrata]